MIYTNFRELVKSIDHSHVYIQAHNFPDPDAISSAYALQYLLKKERIESTIIYSGKIDKYSTNKLISELGIEIFELGSVDEIKPYDEIIVVDSQTGNPNVKDVGGHYVACVDHHPIFEEHEYRFKDIRPKVGACASILASYFIEYGIPFPKNIATALMYGLKVDTATLSRGVSNLDLNMFYTLYSLCDMDLINSLESSIIEFDDLQAYANAILSIKVYDNLAFANTGNHCPEALIATISDFMMSINGVNISIVYSIKVDGIKISVRCDANKFDAGLLTNEALKGLGSGGGHKSMAGGFVPYRESREKLGELLENIENRFIDNVIRLERYNLNR